MSFPYLTFYFMCLPLKILHQIKCIPLVRFTLPLTNLQFWKQQGKLMKNVFLNQKNIIIEYKCKHCKHFFLLQRCFKGPCPEDWVINSPMKLGRVKMNLFPDTNKDGLWLPDNKGKDYTVSSAVGRFDSFHIVKMSNRNEQFKTLRLWTYQHPNAVGTSVC